MASEAAQSVFQTYELLEPVLLHLPLRDILLAQRIDKACHDVIQRSQDIRKALFLAPAARVSHQPGNSKRIFNPFIKMHNLASRIDHKNTERKRLLRGEDAVFISAGIRADPQHPDHFFACQRGAMLGYAQQSRHSMSISHPPVRAVMLTDTCLVADRPSHDLVYNTSGVSYEDLLFCASKVWQTSEKKTPGMCYVEDADSWLQFAGSIDSITGFEMLEMLDVEVQELIDRGLVVVHKGVETKVRAQCGYYIENSMD